MIDIDIEESLPTSTMENLGAIMTYSPFRTMEQIKAEFLKIQSPTGTRIVIANLRSHVIDDKVVPEFDFSVPGDILINNHESSGHYKQRLSQECEVPLDYSLRVCTCGISRTPHDCTHSR